MFQLVCLVDASTFGKRAFTQLLIIILMNIARYNILICFYTLNMINFDLCLLTLFAYFSNYLCDYRKINVAL